MKITQFITNTKLWQTTLFALLFLFSFSIHSQNVGDDLMANTNGQLDTSQVTGSGTGCAPCGWTAMQGTNYAPSNGSHGDVHSGDRMFKMFAGNGGSGELVAQEFSQLPLGTYTLTFYHKWTNGGQVDYSAGDGPQLTIKESNGDGTWTNVHAEEVPLGNIGASAAWTEMTVTWVNTSVNDYKMQIFKNGGSSSAPTNMFGSLHLDTFSFVFTEAASTGPTAVVAPWSDDFEDADASDWSLLQAGDASQGWILANGTNGSIVMYHADDNVATGVDNYLVAPMLDMSGLTSPLLSYSERGSYPTYYTYHGVLISSDYAGDVAAATWTVLTEGVAPSSEEVKEFSIPSTTTGIAFRYQGDYSDTWEIDNVSVTEAPTAPAMEVSATTDGGSATFSFDIENFTVGASGDTGVDGHIHYSLNGGSTVMIYSADDLTLTGLPNGDHSIVFSLVDASHNPLDPAVESTVAFSTFDGTAACGDTVTYTQVNGNTYTLTVTASAGQNVSVTVNGQLESNYDSMTITDSTGTTVNAEVDGVFQDAVYTADGTMTITVSNDSSVNYGDMTFAFACASSQSNVTFSVDMSNYPGGLGADDTVHLNGSFAGWCGDCIPMSDDDGDGIWTVTIPLDDGDYEYKFTVNGWSNQEQWPGDGTPACAENADDGTYENRAFTVAGADLTLQTVYWNLCIGEEPGETYTVTFSVNTSSIIGGVGANGLYAGGGVLGNAQALQLLDDDGDGVYVGSIDLPEGSTGNYIFLNSPNDGGDWGAKENLEGQDCADVNNYNDRILDPVTADTTLLACFGECSGNGTGECSSDTVTYMLTMTVNTANISVGENGMYLGGGVFGGANAYAMSDDDGDGTWEVTVEVADGTSGNYTFLNSPTSSSDWDAKENLEGQECADPNNYNDRILGAVTADSTLQHCFGSCETDGSCPEGDPAIMLQGIMDFTVPSGGSDGKAIHLYVNQDVDDLSQYGIGVANNGGGTDGEEYSLPAGSATAGQHILVARSFDAMNSYMNASAIFDQMLEASTDISQNGDDAIELYFLGGLVETFGDPNVDGTGEAWEYMDSWAYKVNGDWTYGTVNCTDDTTTTCESSCPYPFADCSASFDLYAEGGLRYQYEVAGYRGVGSGGAMNAEWWNSAAYEDFNNAAFPNPSGVNNGMVDDLMFFTEDGNFTFDTGEDGTIMGKKPEIDAAFDPDGSIAYNADNDYNEYWNYPLDDFTDTYVLGNDGTYSTIEFATVGALGFYTSTGAQVYQILDQTANTIYVRNVGSEGNSWYSMLTTDAHALSTNENEILDMMVYPNPVDGNYVTILSPVQGLKEIQVYTIDGRKVMDTSLNGNTLNVSSFNSGFYMLKVTINGQSKVSKLVVR